MERTGQTPLDGKGWIRGDRPCLGNDSTILNGVAIFIHFFLVIIFFGITRIQQGAHPIFGPQQEHDGWKTVGTIDSHFGSPNQEQEAASLAQTSTSTSSGPPQRRRRLLQQQQQQVTTTTTRDEEDPANEEEDDIEECDLGKTRPQRRRRVTGSFGGGDHAAEQSSESEEAEEKKKGRAGVGKARKLTKKHMK